MNKFPNAFGGRVIFDHLPKTAGYSIHSWLIGELGQGVVSPIIAGEHFQLINRLGGKFSMIFGHFHFNGAGLDPRYKYITCLRDPIERVNSLIWFILNNHSESKLGELWSQARLFIDSDGDVLGNELLHHIKNRYVEHFASAVKPGNQTELGKLESALAVANQYDLIGFCDDIPLFCKTMGIFLQITVPKNIPKINVTNNKVETKCITKGVRKKIEELNFLDLEFYHTLKGLKFIEQQNGLVSEESTYEVWDKYSGPENLMFSVFEFKLISAKILSKRNPSVDEDQTVYLSFSISKTIDALNVGIQIMDENQIMAFGTTSEMLGKTLENLTPGTYSISFNFPEVLLPGKYHIGFAFENVKSRKKYAWFDRLLQLKIPLLESRHSIGYADFPMNIDFEKINGTFIDLIQDGKGQIKLINKFSTVLTAEAFSVNVEFMNLSNSSWTNLHLHPISLSYHWLDERGLTIEYEGLRTPINLDSIDPNVVFVKNMRIKPPSFLGRHILQITLLQEGNRWLENCGFNPLCIVVDICDAKQDIHGL